MKIGVRLESLGLPFRKALAAAQRLGVSGVQLGAVGDLAPDRLTESGRRELRYLLRSHGLELTALGCPLRHGFDSALDLQQRIDHVRRVLALSFDLGARIAIVQSGRIPENADDPRRGLLTESLLALGQFGDRVGAVLALETGLESGATLRQFLEPLDTGGLGVNFDPANLLMNGFEPLTELAALMVRIVHVHAKDARAGAANRAAQEVPLGHGDIDWLKLLGTIGASDYAGWVVVERETGADPAADISAGVALLRRLGG